MEKTIPISYHGEDCKVCNVVPQSPSFVYDIRLKSSATLLRASAPKSLQRAMDLAQEKVASSCLPLEEFGLTLHKGAFRDAISLRYGWQPLHTLSTCPCGTNFTVVHALSCRRGVFQHYTITRSGTSQPI